METINHRGRIVSISPDCVRVEIISRSACSSCHAKALCSLSEVESKFIELPFSEALGRNVGDEVDVILTASMGFRAVWLAYVLPLMILIAALLIPVSLGKGELFSGLLSIGAVALYYLCLALFKDRLKKEYIFKIK